MQDISIIRIFRYALAVMIVLTTVAYSNPANAETGTLSINAQTNSHYWIARSTTTTSNPVWTELHFDVADYNKIQYFSITTTKGLGGFVFDQNASSTTFTISSCGSGSGTATYNKFGSFVYWIFDGAEGATVTCSPLVLVYENNIFSEIHPNDGTTNTNWNVKASISPNATHPIYIKTADVKALAANTIESQLNSDASTSKSFSNEYNVTYSTTALGLLATVRIDKSISSVFSQVNITNSTSLKFVDSMGLSNYDYSFLYDTGIALNMTDQSGNNDFVVVNSTFYTGQGAPTPPITPGDGGSVSGQITYNFNNATIGNTYGINANISSANFTAFTTFYIYGYDAFDNLVTGFPVSFNTQNYSTGKFWNFNVSGNYNATLKYCSTLDFTCSNALGILHTLDTASVYIPPASYAFSVTTDQANYQPGNTINIVATNPSPNPAYLTAFGETGIITDIAWNTLIPAGQSVGLSKVIPSNMPLGTYTLNIATTTSYYPIVAQAVFNISSPGNTTNTLSALWGESIYLLGNVGMVTTTSNWNASTLTITSPSGITTSFSFPANSTNYTLITLDIAGQWNARIVDNNNASVFIQSNTTVTAGNPTDNQTIELCKSAATYICWDKRQYTQGQAYTISFRQVPKITDFLNPYIEITNPSGTVIYNQTVNGTWNANAGIYSGSISGNFDPQASIGVYFARLKNKNLLGGTEIEAESSTEVIAGATPTTTEGQVSTTTATNLLNVLGMIAFYGLMIYVGLLYGLIKLMTRNGGQIDSMGFIYAAVVLANIVALIGLFDPFKMYVLVLTWIIAGANFMLGRRTVTGGQ